jgi:hypothetical protein
MRKRSVEDRHTVEVMSQMAWIYLLQSRYEEAEQLSVEALEINLHQQNPNDWWTLRLQHVMAESLWNLGHCESNFSSES